MQFDIRCLETTVSTNDDAKAAAESGCAEGTVFWALQQSAGRGRLGRQWQSPVGNLYFSVVLRPSLPVSQWGKFSFVAALAICDALRALLPPDSVKLKWPNDVLVNGKKISGILLEAGEGWLVAGMGINVSSLPENPLYPVTSLVAEGVTCPLNHLLDSILAGVARWSDALNNQGFALLRAAWLEQARKGLMRVRLPSSPEISGEFADLDEDGNLRLILPDGSEKAIHTGDVFF